MADVKVLTRDTSREEYFYRLGFQEGYKSAAFSFVANSSEESAARRRDQQNAVVVQNALSQVEPDSSFFDE